MNHFEGISRRMFLAAAGATIAGSRLARAAGRSPFAAIEAQLGGRVGVMAIDTGNGDEMLHRADERFAMCSTFKWLLAAMVLSRADSDDIALSERIGYGPDDLLTYAPVTREHVQDGSMTVEALCGAAVTLSDNTAANLLLERVGGPAAFTAFLRQCGDTVTRLDRNEPGLNTNIPGDERDTTTPRAMAKNLDRILLGDVVSATSRGHLVRWLKETTTGLSRLRAGLPNDWIAGDKTGSGENGATNDVAIAWPPQRKPILIASYLSDSTATADAKNAAHAAIAASIVKRMAGSA